MNANVKRRIPLARFGERGRLVNVYALTDGLGYYLARVEWNDSDGSRKTKSFNVGTDNQRRKAAERHGKQVAESLAGGAPPEEPPALEAAPVAPPVADSVVAHPRGGRGTPVSTRRAVRSYGSYGCSVNVFDLDFRYPNGVTKTETRIEWRYEGKRYTRSVHGTELERHQAAETYADAVIQKITTVEAAPQVPALTLTVGDLWRAYLKGKQGDWKPATTKLVKSRWKVFCLHMDPEVAAEHFNGTDMNTFRDKMFSVNTKRGVPMAGAQIAGHLDLIKGIFSYALQLGLITTNPIVRYTVRTGTRYAPADIAEFSPEEWRAMLMQLNNRSKLQWRGWAMLALDGLLAVRLRALVRLEWSWVDLDANCIVWPAGVIKQGRPVTHFLTPDLRMILRVCKVWARREDYTGPYVFFGRYKDKRETHISAHNVYWHLAEAQRRAGITPKPYRGMHGLRRMRGKEIYNATKDLLKVGLWLGNTDIRVLKRSYVKDRREDYDEILASLSMPR